jgi:Ni/Fe-hydrogenase subunit HybB-like protein
MPIVFLFSAMVSGIALVLLLYAFIVWVQKQPLNMPCIDTIARYLLYAFIVDASLELLDLIHRIYEADESFKALDFMVKTRLFFSQIVLQIILGTLVPIGLLGTTQLMQLAARTRVWMYSTAATLALIGIFAMRWNVVIGGQLFSKSFLGYTTYKLDFVAREGLLPAIALLILPFLVLAVLIKVLPPMAPADGELTVPRQTGTAHAHG